MAPGFHPGEEIHWQFKSACPHRMNEKEQLLQATATIANRLILDSDNKEFIVSLQTILKHVVLEESDQVKESLLALERLADKLARRITVFHHGDDDAEWYRAIRYFYDPNSPEDRRAGGRPWLEQVFLPLLEGSVLSVGVGSYTGFYHKLVKNPELFETMDILAEVVRYGSPYTHYLGDLRYFKSDHSPYDNVVMYGIFGCGPRAIPPSSIVDAEGVMEGLTAADQCVRPGGTLMVCPGMIEYSAEFWEEIFKLPLFDKYEVIEQTFDDGYVWWARKHV